MAAYATGPVGDRSSMQPECLRWTSGMPMHYGSVVKECSAFIRSLPLGQRPYEVFDQVSFIAKRMPFEIVLKF